MPKREYENHNVLAPIKEAATIAYLLEEKVTLSRSRLPGGQEGMRRYLGVDPGLKNCAVALWCRNSEGEISSVFTAKITPPESMTNKPFLQALYVQRILEQIILDHTPRFVVKEGPAYNAPQTAHDLGRVHQSIEMACFNTGVPVIVVAPTSALSYIGARKKDETRQLFYKKFGIEFPTADECDAANIGKTGEAILLGEYPRPKVKPVKKVAAPVKAVAKKPARKKASRKKARR